MTDRMSAALTAVALIERPHDDELNALLPTEITEAMTVLSSAVWCAQALSSQLALHTGVEREAILAELRGAIIDAFASDTNDDERTDDNDEN